MNNYPTINMKATGARITELRKSCGLKVKDISDFMGFTEPQAVYKWQRGESLPSLDNIYALSKLFHTTIEDIIVSDPVADVVFLLDFYYTCKDLFVYISIGIAAVLYMVLVQLVFV